MSYSESDIMPGPIEDLRRGAEAIEFQAVAVKNSLAQGNLECLFLSIDTLREAVANLEKEARSYLGIRR